MSTIKHKLIEFIVTFLYVGKIRYCPGTFGSLCAFPISYWLACMIRDGDKILMNFNYLPITMLILINTIVALLLFIVGIYYSSLYIKITNRQDPKEVVIDEVVGQMLTSSMCLLSLTILRGTSIDKILTLEFRNLILFLLLPFILFRIFDIVKPWPISWLDQNIDGGLGVMIDDVLASCFASVVYFLIIFFTNNKIAYILG
ncbi:MAG: phosphatidylglycerophosphatase A [Rickettsiaceae bacterium]|nr:MAG: phosphatidylglycerophosphatase A [Rickettsiaceae bacterium]